MAHSFADHFSRVATDYASYRPRYPKDLFAWLAGLPARRELAWDCAAGSGQATVGRIAFLPDGSRMVSASAFAARRWPVAPDGAIGPSDFVAVPTAMAVFANEFVPEGEPPRSWLQRAAIWLAQSCCATAFARAPAKQYKG